MLPGLETVTAVPGFGRWDCEWEADRTRVGLYFERRAPLDENDGMPVVFHGRAGAVELQVNGACYAYITFGDAARSTDVVHIEVSGPQPEAERCAHARTLADAAAGRLPPPR